MHTQHTKQTAHTAVQTLQKKCVKEEVLYEESTEIFYNFSSVKRMPSLTLIICAVCTVQPLKYFLL